MREWFDLRAPVRRNRGWAALMEIASGTRLGPYEVVSRLGSGGMGEVWKARDTRLDRGVAIKVLSTALAQNAQFRMRFEREARTVSQLNHPNICTLHDFGESDGIAYLVMEYLDGESLADRIGRGPLPLADVLRVGREIAEALERAHRSGVVHRDLKPGNVMLTRTGAKLLDFGLAKSNAAPAPTADDATQHKALTQEGTILGTFQYMAPEQVAGEEADHRSDIFALGVVLYEMLTGQRAFTGASRTSLFAAIVGGEPRPMRELQPLTPPALEHIITKCLEKDPERRWQSAHDIADQLRWIADSGSQTGLAAPPRKGRFRASLATLAAIVFFASTATLAGLLFRMRAGAVEQPVLRAAIVAEDGRPYELNGPAMAVSPDGRSVAIAVKSADGKTALYVRPLDGAAQPIAGTDGAFDPFWSPDGRNIGFFADLKLKRVAVTGAGLTTLAPAPDPRGGAWNADGVILFTPSSSGPIFRIPADGGEPAKVTTIDTTGSESSHRWPSFLPDGRHFLYLRAAIDSIRSGDSLWVGSLDPKDAPKRLIETESRGVFSSGSVLFVRERNLLAQKFDPAKLELGGSATQVAEDIRAKADITGAQYFSASPGGVLVYERSASREVQLTWVDRQGKPLSVVGTPGLFNEIRVSPDGSRIAAQVPASDTSAEPWVLDARSDARTRLSLTGNDAISTGGFPAWMPDGTRVVYALQGRKSTRLTMKGASGASERTLLELPGAAALQDVSPGGEFLLVNLVGQGNKPDLWCIPLDGRKPLPVATSPANEGWGRISPDGRWVVYESDESGPWQIYAAQFPPGPNGARLQLTNGGADWIVGWRRDGRELYFIRRDMMMAAPVETSADEIVLGEAKPLFALSSGNTWDAAGDGTRFLVGRPAAGSFDKPITLLTNWSASLKE